MTLPFKNRAGFTIIEILSVLVVIGIVGAFVASRLIQTGSDTAGEVARLKSNLRFAQYLAMTDNTKTWGISIASNSYTLLENGSTASINFPGSNSSTRTFPPGVSITSGTGTITFDEWGSPGSTTRTITFSDGSTITVTKNTGFIP